MERIFRLLAKRWSSKSPDIFKKLTDVFFYSGLAVGVIASVPIGLPAWLVTGLGIASSSLIGLSGGTKLTTTSTKLKKESNEIFKNKKK